MGHHLTGVIGTAPILRAFALARGLHAPVALASGLALLPLRDDDIDTLVPSPQSFEFDGFTYLSRQLLAMLCDASRAGPLLYVETDYFGGEGGQGAALCRDGQLAFGPRWGSDHPINQALALLGVTTEPPAADEFDTVGLGLCRNTEDWLEHSGPLGD